MSDASLEPDNQISADSFTVVLKLSKTETSYGSTTDLDAWLHWVTLQCMCAVQDSGNGVLEATLCFEHADQSTFRTYYVIADNTLGRQAEAVELHPGCISQQ